MKSRSFTILAIVAVLAMLAYAIDASAAMHTLTFDPSMLVLAGAPAALEIKDLVAAIDRLESSAGKDVGEIKEKVGELQARLQEAEQKLDKRGGSGGSADPSSSEWLTPILDNHTSFKSLREGHSPVCRIELPKNFMEKALPLSTVSGSGAVLGDPDRQAGILLPGQRRMRIRDLLPKVPTTQGSVEYIRETSFTNNAAIVSETMEKPESTIDFALQSAKVATLAHWLHATKQIIDDVPYLQQYIDTRLRYGLAFVEESQLLYGSGVGNNLAGLNTQATPFAAPISIASATQMDTLRLAMCQLENSYYDATAFIVHPNNWCAIELLKNADGDYLKSHPGDANARQLWGKPVVVTSAITLDTFLTGDFTQAAIIFDRQTPTLDIAFTDRDDFTKNMCKLRVEERLALATQLPGALVKGHF